MLGSRGFRPGAVLLAAGLTAVFYTAAVSGEDQSAPTAVRVGVVGSLLRDVPAPLAETMMRPFQSLMEAQTGLTSQVSVGGEAEHLGEQLAKDKVQLGVFHGVEFAWARQKFPEIKAFMIAVNQQRYLKAHLIVRADSPANGFADLQGKILALPRMTREHTRLFAERRCESCGMQVSRFFSQVTTPPDIEDALDHVVDGTVHATVVDSVALENYQKRKPGRFAKLKTAQESEVFPTVILAFHPGGIEKATLKRFRDGMIGASKNRRGQQMLALCRMTGFELVPVDYEQLFTDIMKAYPPPGNAK